MKVGIFGPAQSGKTTLFRAASGLEISASGPTDINKGTVLVADPRVDWLTELYKPKRKVAAKLELVDLPPFAAQPDRKHDNVIAEAVRDCDLLCLVLDDFDKDRLFHDRDPDPVRDWNEVISEMILRDMISVEARLERMRKSRKPGEGEIELKLFERLHAALEEEKPLGSLDLSAEEKKMISGSGLLTLRPMMAAINVSEDGVADMDQRAASLASQFPGGVVPLPFCGSLEAEISGLPEDEQLDFAREMGLAEPGRNRLIREAYRQLQRISFFTVGPDEVRAWTLRKGTGAKEAAGEIHSDLQRGFIKAEVVGYDAFHEAGSEEEAKKAKLYRLEGPTYEVKDGDIMEIRFNV